jgi:hypothetical protein
MQKLLLDQLLKPAVGEMLHCYPSYFRRQRFVRRISGLTCVSNELDDAKNWIN